MARSGHRLHKGVRVTRLITEQRALRVELDDESSLLVAMVVLAIGVRPRDDVARRAGLVCDLFGGIVVDDDLSTSKPGIFAIGECVRHRQVSYGIVAPGYQMAEVLAQRLLGRDVRFSGATMTTRLKRSEVAVCAVGESTVADLATLHCEREDELGYRRLVVRRGRLIGLSVVGDWDEPHLAQQAVLSKRKLGRRQLERFARGEPLFGHAAVELSPLKVSAARAEMRPEAEHRTLTYDSCHSSHAADARSAAVDACTACHAGEHTRSYEASAHAALWRRELSGDGPAGSGVSCAACHMPRVPVVQDLGRRHQGYGVLPQHYETVATALLDTLEKGLGEAWTPETREAWVAVYGVLSATMLDACD